jgi:hypothetical protein
MDWFEMSPAEAERVLDTWARQSAVPVCAVSEALTRGICQGRATGCDDTVLRQLEERLRQLPPPPSITHR